MKNIFFKFKALKLDTMDVYEVVSINFDTQKLILKKENSSEKIESNFENVKLLECLSSNIYTGDVFKSKYDDYAFVYRNHLGINICFIDKDRGRVQSFAGDHAITILNSSGYKKVGYIWQEIYRHLLYRYVNPEETDAPHV